MKLGKLLIEAYREAGISLPKRKDERSSKRNFKENKTITKNKKTVRTSITNKRVAPCPNNIKKLKKVASKNENVTFTSGGVKITRRKLYSENNKVTNSFTYRDYFAKGIVKESKSAIYPKTTIQNNAELIWNNTYQVKSSLFKWQHSGSALELGVKDTEKHLYLGLDFGTSSLKAVIHDKERDYNYAVPFIDLVGINSYLLPCRLYIYKNKYNLERGEILSQDLKLDFLATPNDKNKQLRIVAFLALALQRIRSWLLSNHGDTYSGSIIWEMTMGLPVAHTQDQFLVDVFKKIGIASWIASTNKIISDAVLDKSIIRASELFNGTAPKCIEEDIVVNVEPEITAQIYGFVSSTAYNPSAKNYYLMVDIGAGTLDASIFYINRSKTKKNEADFSIFRTSIQPYGVMNWHSDRVKWLSKLLQVNHPDRKDLQAELRKIYSITDTLEPIPDLIEDYFRGLSISLSSSQCPDNKFYSKVRNQVARDTYLYVERNNIVERQHMKEMPMLICGGGSRSNLYKRLKKDMFSAANASWFGARYQALQTPRNLYAKGINRIDYDRLAVAYGLSQMKTKKIIYDVPPLETIENISYTDRYVEKDFL